MKTLKSIGDNETEIKHDNGTIELYSYSTLVAVFVPGQGALCTTTKYSKTTTRHINKALARWNATRHDTPQSTIDTYQTV